MKKRHRAESVSRVDELPETLRGLFGAYEVDAEYKLKLHEPTEFLDRAQRVMLGHAGLSAQFVSRLLSDEAFAIMHTAEVPSAVISGLAKTSLALVRCGDASSLDETRKVALIEEAYRSLLTRAEVATSRRDVRNSYPDNYRERMAFGIGAQIAHLDDLGAMPNSSASHGVLSRELRSVAKRAGVPLSKRNRGKSGVRAMRALLENIAKSQWLYPMPQGGEGEEDTGDVGGEGLAGV